MVGSEENYNFDLGVKGLREELIPFAPIYLLFSYFYGSNLRQLKKAMAHDSPL